MSVHVRASTAAFTEALGIADRDSLTGRPKDKHVRRRGVLVLVAIAALGCDGSTELPTTPAERVAGIYSNLTILFGHDSLQAQAWAVGPMGDSLRAPVTLSALTPAIATITSAEVIHTHSDGTALFLATADGFADTIPLLVFVTRVARITATPDSVSLVVGDSLDLDDLRLPFRIRTFDAMGNEMYGVPVRLTSSEPAVVLTSSYLYEIIAKRIGRAVLTARADTASTTIKVTVKSGTELSLE